MLGPSIRTSFFTSMARRPGSATRVAQLSELPGTRDSAGVAFDRLLVAQLRALGILAELAPRAALAQQVPALVERHLDALQPLAVRIGRLASCLALEERVLLARQLIDPIGYVPVVHDVSPFAVRMARLEISYNARTDTRPARAFNPWRG